MIGRTGSAVAAGDFVITGTNSGETATNAMNVLR